MQHKKIDNIHQMITTSKPSTHINTFVNSYLELGKSGDICLLKQNDNVISNHIKHLPLYYGRSERSRLNNQMTFLFRFEGWLG